MSRRFKVACVQNTATPDVMHDVQASLTIARDAAKQGAQLIATPEYFAGLRTEDAMFRPSAYSQDAHPALQAFSDAAKQLNVWFLLGSVGVSDPQGRIFNRSCLISSSGDLVAKYDKIHMFDVDLEGGSYRESATISPGNQAVVADTPWARLGLTICYDLRFAALYRTLSKMGAEILTCPAAFTRVTGQAHWHVLQRARAIEHGSFVLAPCQYGEISGGGACFGHSLIVDPWGEVLADAGTDEGFICEELDMTAVEAARSRIPALSHDRMFLGASAPQGEASARTQLPQSSEGVPIRSA
jgi:predicted amidohydrolase